MKILSDTRTGIFCSALALLAIAVCAAPDKLGADNGNTAQWHNSEWAHVNSDLEPDPKVSFGRLKNGLRYAFLQNDTPPGRVSMQLDVQVGSLMEEDAEQGFAHFVEHMAFNGSKNLAPGTLIPFFQQNGMGFGVDSNAHTAFDETVYKLNLAANDRDSLAAGLTVLRDFADGQIMDPDEIESEKGVILAEKNARENEAVLAARARRAWLYKGTPLVRDVIGLEETIGSAGPESLMRFYRRWYSPERMILVISGTFDHDAARLLLEDKFGDIKPGVQNAAFNAETLPRVDKPGLQVLMQKRDIGHTEISLAVPHRRVLKPDNLAARRDMLADNLVSFCLNQRLQRSEMSASGLWIKAVMRSSARSGKFPSFTFAVICAPKNAAQACRTLLEELRNACMLGFNAEEVEKGLEFYRKALIRGLETEKSHSNDTLAEIFIKHANSNQVFTAAAEDLRAFEAVAAQITPQTLTEALRLALEPENKFLTLSGKLELGESEARSIWREVWAAAPQERAAAADIEFPYPIPPEPAGPLPVLAPRAAPAGAPEIMQGSLPNGVVLYLIPGDTIKNKISLAVYFGRGISSGRGEDYEKKTDTARLAEMVLAESGLGGLNRAEKTLLFRSHGLDMREIYTARYAVIRGSGNSGGLDKLILAAWSMCFMQKPTVGAHDLALQKIAFENDRRRKTVDGRDQAEAENFFFGNRGRFRYLDEHAARAIELDEVRAFLHDARARGPRYVILTGDFSPEAALPLLARFFGALPDLPESPPAKPPPPSFPAGQSNSALVASLENKAVLRVAWRFDPPEQPGPAQQRDLLISQLATSALRDRLRIDLREKLGAVYSPGARYRYLAQDGFGLLMVSVSTKIDQLETVRAALDEMRQKLGAADVSGEELDRIRKPMFTALDTAMTRPDFWGAQLHSELLLGEPYLLWAGERRTLMESISPAEVQTRLREFMAAPKAEFLTRSE